MTNDQLNQYLYERLEADRESFNTMREAMRATARATRTIADSLSAAEKRHQSGDSAVSRVEAKLEKIDRRIEDIHLLRSPSAMSPEELANIVDFNKLCEARRIVWKRTHPNEGWDEKDPTKAPRPLPPLPQDLPVVRARNDDPTGTFKRPPKGKRKKVEPIVYAAMIGWGAAVIMVAIEIIRLISGR